MAKFEIADLERLAQIVREVTGNLIQVKNYPMLEARLSTHMMVLGLKTIADYWVYFQKNGKAEREALQSLMTTHHTFFFREYVHFEELEKWVAHNHARLVKRKNDFAQPVRVWSAACSRGQEAYSIAMCLDQILTRKYGVEFEVIGTDIDRESVVYAQNGVYPLKEVNSIPSNFLNEYFLKGSGKVAEFAAVKSGLKNRTRFSPLNLIEPATWTIKESFDIIFCRNVFIYFSEENVRLVASALADRMVEGGLFVSGISEPLRFEGWNLPAVGSSSYLKQADPALSKAAVRELSNEDLKEKKYRVLCVDDSPVIQLLLKNIFSRDPQCDSVAIANNGREARDLLNVQTFDLITLDIHMPEVNGIEFLQSHYNRQKDPPVIMVSSVNRTDLDLATKALSLGAIDYIEKPSMNNLAKTAEELKTKAHLAIRSNGANRNLHEGTFDASIGARIVIPDASQCLRILIGKVESVSDLKNAMVGQKSEYRSPPTLILTPSKPTSIDLAEMLKWTDRKVLEIGSVASALKPNTVYVADASALENIIASTQFKRVSLQVFGAPPADLGALRRQPSVQVLVSETVADLKKDLEKIHRFHISDICPGTSFASLSVEYFADLRKAAA